MNCPQSFEVWNCVVADFLGSGSMITDGNGAVYQTLIYAAQGEIIANIKNGEYDESYKFSSYYLDNESSLDYAGARYYWSDGTFFLSTDPLWFDYPDIHSYHFCHNNPVMRTDETGMGDDIYVYKDKDGKETSKSINTGDKTPNRLFVQDEKATADTKNRKEHDGMFFEQKMIPKEAYSPEDFEEPTYLLFFKGDSQFYTDRSNYIWSAGEYSDKTIAERRAEDAIDAPGQFLDIATTILSRGKGGSVINGVKNGFAHTKKAQSTGKLKGAKGDRHAKQYNQGGNNRPVNPNKRAKADEHRNKGKIIN